MKDNGKQMLYENYVDYILIAAYMYINIMRFDFKVIKTSFWKLQNINLKSFNIFFFCKSTMFTEP